MLNSLFKKIRVKARRLLWGRPNLQSSLELPSTQRAVLVEPGNGFGAMNSLYRGMDSQSSCLLKNNNLDLPLREVQVLTRYCFTERPYWNSFLSHYSLLGVSRVDVCVQSEAEQNELLSISTPEGMKLKIHLLTDKLDPSQALQRLPINSIRDDYQWILLADCDEYFQILNPNFTVDRLSDLYADTAQFYVPWLMSPRLTWGDSSFSGFWGHIGKPMVRSQNLVGVANDHSFYTAKSCSSAAYASLPVGALGIALVHFWSRSFRDCLLKTFCNRFKDEKSSDLHEAVSLIREGKLPARLKLLAYLIEQQQYLQFREFPNLRVDIDAEEQLLREFLSEEDEKICSETFSAYRQKIKLKFASLPIYPAISLLEVVRFLPD